MEKHKGSSILRIPINPFCSRKRHDVACNVPTRAYSKKKKIKRWKNHEKETTKNWLCTFSDIMKAKMRVINEIRRTIMALMTI